MTRNSTHTPSGVNWEEYAAELYDALLILQPYQEYLAQMIRMADISHDSCVLDAGCGTGNLTEKILAQHPALVHAIDYSEAMVATAIKKCGDGAIIQKGDLQKTLPYADATFDIVTCGNVLYALPEPSITLRELWRIMKPSGTLVLASPKEGYENGLILKAHCQNTDSDEEWMGAHSSPSRERELIERTFDNQSTIELFLELSAHNRRIKHSAATHLYTPTSLRSLLKTCGYADVTITETYAKQNLLAVCKKGEQ